MNDIKAHLVDRSSFSAAASAYGKEQQAASGKEIEGTIKSGNGLPANVERIADVSEKQVKEAVSKLNDYVQSTQRTLDFQMDEESGKTVIKVYDTLSAELIRQIPNELALELAQNLNDEEPSLLFSAQV
ncbi:MAG: flagellar protein FlaG [Oleispira sp.]|nr:flagellar protein FlaG [Oleispira sp.]MBL4881699.1 flagellar protein FlaG [Oleispira sp.]